MAAPNPLFQALVGTEGLIAPQKPKDLFASLLIKNALSTEPVGHWTQGAARMAQALLGGLELRGQETDEAARKGAPDEISSIATRLGLGGSPSGSSVAQPAPPPSMPPQQRPMPAPSVAGNLPAAPPPNDPTMTVSPRQVAMANGGAPPNFNDRFSAASQPPPGAVPVQTAQVQATQPSAPTSAPDLMSAAQEMRKSKNPYVKAYGTQIMLQELTRSPEFEIKTENGVTVAVDKRNPRNRHVIDDPALAQTLIQREGQRKYTESFAGEQAKKDVAKPERTAMQHRSANIVVQDIDRALKGLGAPGMASTGPVAALARSVPGTNAFNLDQLLETVRSNASFDRLQQMREASPTGGALGAVTERELTMLQTAIGNMDIRQDKGQFQDNMRRVKNIYLDIIHGPGNGPAREKLSFDQQQQSAQGGGLSAGRVVNGFRYRGGDPNDRSSWEPAR